MLNLVNYICDGDGRIALVTGSTLTVRMSNCRRINDTGAQTAFLPAADLSFCLVVLRSG